MTVDEWLCDPGYELDERGLSRARERLAALAAAEREDPGCCDAAIVRLICAQLFSVGELSDVLRIATARAASDATRAAVELELLCGAGLDATMSWLEASTDPIARDALGELRSARRAGGFDHVSREDVRSRHRARWLSKERGPDKIGDRLLMQRIRNRIIEYLSLAASFEAQRRYQELAPVCVPNEVINRWEDYTRDPTRETFEPSVFTPDEADALVEYHRVWHVAADALDDGFPDLEETLQLPEWEQLRDAAQRALAILERRGFLSEELEISRP
ncbi:MAG: hypothetical protein JNK05_05715 [Myxococcales bacterium]|nr:hypothetical protein [Myxococcales bacterium]